MSCCDIILNNLMVTRMTKYRDEVHKAKKFSCSRRQRVDKKFLKRIENCESIKKNANAIVVHSDGSIDRLLLPVSAIYKKTNKVQEERYDPLMSCIIPARFGRYKWAVKTPYSIKLIRGFNALKRKSNCVKYIPEQQAWAFSDKVESDIYKMYRRLRMNICACDEFLQRFDT